MQKNDSIRIEREVIEMKRFIPAVFILIGIYWTVMSFSYGLWIRGGPGGGFLPLVAGILAIIFGVVVTMAEFKDKTPTNFTFKAFLPPLILLGIIVVSQLIGIIITLVIYIFSWIRFYEKESYLKSGLVAVLCPAVIYAIFVMWLKVPLPQGILGLL
ncbi:MAG: tripartite tricarboxylate transporter family receptor [Clostridia bacterium]|jgi:hypothetical protein|nr:tripartite tricarboxylate transporter family receptor [Clostridia bacterium]